MNISDYSKYFRDRLKPEVVYAGEYLESKGLRFAVDFGSTNAIAKAADMMVDEFEWGNEMFGELG